jgi:EAL domain-containing protein (putative c-di-GMP-specific phosphodiesterase class I)
VQRLYAHPNAGNTQNALITLRGNVERISMLVPPLASPLVPSGTGWAEAPLNSLALSLSSHFQPILGVAERNVVGYEGLLLAHNSSGQTLHPETLFGMAQEPKENVYLDLLARALHIRNFPILQSGSSLFLNVLPEAAAADLGAEDTFKRIIALYGAEPRDLVIEILETGAADEGLLREAVQLYKRLGCRVALDDFGIGASNFERLCHLQPDIVKIDRSVMRAAARDRNEQRAFNNLVRMIHECGAAAAIEGVEERRDALIALEADADYLQGFYFGHPGRAAMDLAAAATHFGPLIHLYDSDADVKQVGSVPEVREYAWLVENMAAAIERGAGFELAAEALLDNPHAVRAYLLAHDGAQRSSASNRKNSYNPRTKESESADRLGWQLRHLVESALAKPTEVQISRPTSVGTETEQCVSLARGLQLEGESLALCADLLLIGTPLSEPAQDELRDQS